MARAATAENEREDGARRASHRALLHALVGPPDERVTWWEKWRSSIDLADVDPATFYLLPLASRRFAALAGDDTDRLTGIYRYTWYGNRMLLHSGAAVLRRLDEAGIAHLLLKGATLATTTYHDRGARPIGDVDILVPSGDRDRAIAMLLEAGWLPDSPVPAEMLRVHHALNVSTGPLARVDIHWGILYLDRNPEADHRAWARSVPIELDGVATRALCPTDQLVHALVRENVDDLRWIVDAGLLIEQGEVDWLLFCREVETRRVVSWVTRALRIAEDLGGVTVPTAVSDELAGASMMSRWDRVVLRSQQQPRSRSALATRAVDTFARRTRGLSAPARMRAVSPYLAQISGKAPLHRSLSVLTTRLVRPAPDALAP